ncbi:MAG: 4'-phosphopantetheinyl transferase superfamily protein [Candidatus Moranbacteria bacterium]|jgi:phosphopantetheinyl transferase|nr:4'-phosphopantetheinyl transferase superfamily protein [Candidatus Moranbacteria bacterium]
MQINEDDRAERITDLSEFDRILCQRLDFRRQYGFIASRLALCALVQEQGIILDKGASVRSKEDGSPFLMVSTESPQRNSARFVSISHTNQIAFVAFGPDVLGADIESIRKDDRNWAEAFLSSDEIGRKKEIVEREKVDSGTVLTAWWSAKESYLKAIGTGLRTHPRRITCSFDWPRATFCISQPGRASSRGVFSLEKGGYVVALTLLN